MRVAVMQPYLFPYTPYFQLIHAVDCFVLFDTVQYIRRGWMHRNRIKLNGRDHPITFPIADAPRDTPIRNITLANNLAEERERILAKLSHAYRKASHWNQVDEIVIPLIAEVEPGQPFVDFAERSLISIAGALGIQTQIVRASELQPRRSSDYQNYVMDICHELGARTYINPPGGKHLYDAQAFEMRGMTLRFLQSELAPYSQPGDHFIEGLSVIDILANVKFDDIARWISAYSLNTSH